MSLKYGTIVTTQDDLGRLGVCGWTQLSLSTSTHQLHHCLRKRRKTHVISLGKLSP